MFSVMPLYYNGVKMICMRNPYQTVTYFPKKYCVNLNEFSMEITNPLHQMRWWHKLDRYMRIFWAEDLGLHPLLPIWSFIIFIPATSSTLVFAIPGAVVLAIDLVSQILSHREWKVYQPPPCPPPSGKAESRTSNVGYHYMITICCIILRKAITWKGTWVI